MKIYINKDGWKPKVKVIMEKLREKKEQKPKKSPYNKYA